MRITKDNYREHQAYIANFMRVLNLITKEFVVAGGVVRDIIAPIAMLLEPTDEYTVRHLIELLDKVEYIDLDDIDLAYDFCMVANEMDISQRLLKLLRGGGWIIKDNCIKLNGEIDFYSYELDFDGEFDMMLPTIGFKSTLYIFEPLFGEAEQIKLDILIINDADRFNDFDVNNLTWGYKEKFGLLQDIYVPKGNLYINKQHITYVYIQSIINKIMKKECTMYKSVIEGGILRKIAQTYKMISKGYSITNVCEFQLTYGNFTDLEFISDEMSCRICMEPFQNGEDYIQICKSKVPHFHHPNCIFAWWKYSKSNEVGCSLCRIKLN
jgi:hypothetical protein